MNRAFQILITSDFEHEKVFAEIYFQDKFVAAVTQEQGLDRLALDFPGPEVNETMVLREVDFESFHRALSLARERLAGSDGEAEK